MCIPFVSAWERAASTVINASSTSVSCAETDTVAARARAAMREMKRMLVGCATVCTMHLCRTGCWEWL